MNRKHRQDRLKLAGARNKKRHAAKKWVIGAAAGALLCVLILLLALPSGKQDTSTAQPQVDSAQDTAAEETQGKESFAPYLSEQMKLAHENNPDVVGWLTLEGCEIDDPVVQGEDNDQYLRRTIESEEYDVWGCYFLDYINRQDGKMLKDRVTIIYGHALDDDPNSEKFSRLKRYKDPEFAREHPTFTFSLLYAGQEWEIFAAADMPITIDYIDPNPDDSKYESTLAYMLENSYLDFGVEVGVQDNILILSTCTSDENVRFIVAAKPVEEQAA